VDAAAKQSSQGAAQAPIGALFTHEFGGQSTSSQMQNDVVVGCFRAKGKGGKRLGTEKIFEVFAGADR